MSMNAPTIHVGDERLPVKTIVIVHCDPPTPAEPDAAWLPIDRVAHRLGVSRSKVSRLCSGGDLAHRRIGSKLQVHVDEITRYEAHLQTQTVASGRQRADVKRAARQAMRLVPAGSGGAR
jgi:hypothetical protein